MHVAILTLCSTAEHSLLHIKQDFKSDTSLILFYHISLLIPEMRMILKQGYYLMMQLLQLLKLQ